MTLIIKKINDSKRGVFTDRSFEPNTIIRKIQGKKITREELNKLTPEQQNNVLQIGKDLFLNLEKETEFFINHSCTPNCYIKAIVNSAFLMALKPIAKGEEITFDYSLTSTDDKESWMMLCNCHKYKCRKEISGFELMPEEKRKEAEKKKIVPLYIKKDGT